MPTLLLISYFPALLVPSITRYYRFILLVLAGELLLASSFIFSSPMVYPALTITTPQRWLLMGQLLLMLLLLYSLNYALSYGGNSLRYILNHLPVWQNRAWRIALNAVATLALVVVLHWSNDYLTGKPFSSLLATMRGIPYFLPMLVQVMLMHTLFELNDRWQRVALQNEALKRDQSVARFEALKQQVSPHFLFNSFATLNWLIRDDPAAAERFVQKMSQVYRYVLHQGEQRSVPLGEELAFVESYLYLLHMRFEQNLRVTIDVPADLHAWRLPPLAIQTVIENAVKHNIISQEQPLTIHLSAEPGSFTVRNTLQPRLNPEAPSGVGLKNLNARFHFLGRAGLVARPHDGHFIVTLPLFA